MSQVLRSLVMAFAAGFLLANAEPDDEGTICLAVAHHWRGDSADIKRIRSVPVPDSFRRRFESGGCERFQLIVGSLIDWHLAFGDERTASLALAYLEPAYRKGTPAPEAFGAHLAAAWRDAGRAIAALPPAGDPKRLDQGRLRKIGSVRRASEAAAAYERYVELSGLYMRAAEHYGSAALLEKAELYFLPANAGLATLFAGGWESDSKLGGILHAPSHRLNEVLDLEMRIPILRARLSRAPEDVGLAASVAARRYQPVLETAVDNARERSGEICEIEGEAESETLKKLEAACEGESNFSRRTRDFWRNRAQLDLLMAADPIHFETSRANLPATGSEFGRRPAADADAGPADPPRSFETAAWLLHSDRLKDWEGRTLWFHRVDFELFSLLLARSELHARRAVSDVQEYGPALDYAAEAIRLAAPHEAPALFKTSAQLWLDLWSRASGSTEEARRRGDRARFATYLRANLGSLDSIATGAGGDPASAQ
ncbi:MAG TPA: hypothetical protein VGB04_12195 [Allosphingosinicella sp.]|jgi:hypothetical protein